MLEQRLRELETRKSRIEADMAKEKQRVTDNLIDLFKKTYKAKEVKLRSRIEDFFSGTHFTGVFEIITPKGVIVREEVFRHNAFKTGLNPLQNIRTKYNDFTKEKTAELNVINYDISYITGAQRVLSETPVIRKDNISLFGRQCYSLWLAESPIYLYQGDRSQYLYTTRKDTPLEILSINTNIIMNIADRARAQGRVFNLNTGDLVTNRGYVLNGEQQNIAAGIFEQVMNGIEILPSPTEPSGYTVRRHIGPRQEQEPRFRHWGQTYLAQLNPDEIIEGQLLGSGGSYEAYVFGDKTIVEFDQEERATFFFDTDYFHTLRVWQRREILQRNPEGFEGRIIHHKDRDNWRNSVLNFLGR